jgi:hypothetical protein
VVPVELTKRAASVLSAFAEAGHRGIYCTDRGEVGALRDLGLIERVERDHYRVSKRGNQVVKTVTTRRSTDEQERLADLRAGCDGVSHAAFGHATFRALAGGALLCRACGVEFSPWAPGAAARAALRDLARPPRKSSRSKPARRSRSAIEAAGAAVLESDPAPAAKTAGLGVRFYYLSQGGEVLSFDAGPLTSDAARKLLDAHTSPRHEKVGTKLRGGDLYGYVRRPTSDCLAAALIYWSDRRPVGPQQGAGEAANASCVVPDGSRHVVLPSQHPDPVQVVESGHRGVGYRVKRSGQGRLVLVEQAHAAEARSAASDRVLRARRAVSVLSAALDEARASAALAARDAGPDADDPGFLADLASVAEALQGVAPAGLGADADLEYRNAAAEGMLDALSGRPCAADYGPGRVGRDLALAYLGGYCLAAPGFGHARAVRQVLGKGGS